MGNFSVVKETGEKELVFKKVTNKELGIIKETLEKDFTTSAREVKRILEDNGSVLSLTTVKKAISAAGYSASKPRYCQMIRDTNKVKRVDFCNDLISNDDKFEDAIFSDECSIQLHDNKTVAYRKKDSWAPPKCRPKHPLKIHLWGAISKKGPSEPVTFEGIMDAEFYTENILKDTLLPFVRSGFPEGHHVLYKTMIRNINPRRLSSSCKTTGSTGCRRGRQVRTVCD